MFKVSNRWESQMNSIKVEWNIGKRCNYDCSYCPSEIHDNHSGHVSLDTMKLVIDNLSSLQKPIRLSMTGGEPSVNPNISAAIRYMNEVGIDHISMTTNGTMPSKWYVDQLVDQYVISVHFEYSTDRILQTILDLRSSGCNIIVHLMAIHDKMNELREVSEVLDSKNIKYVVRRVRWVSGDDRDVFDDSRYSIEDMEWIMSRNSTVTPNVVVDNIGLYHANDIIKLHLNKYKGWSCNAGLESLMINWDGEVHRATCRVGGSLGNIYTGSFNEVHSPVICDRTYCTCAADIPITKFSC
jgi:MoaA/NifB/PqqE/SkfB family radical SAM enzyme